MTDPRINSSINGSMYKAWFGLISNAVYWSQSQWTTNTNITQIECFFLPVINRMQGHRPKITQDMDKVHRSTEITSS